MANQALNNLKTIHNLQKEGSILEKLREIRALKQSLEDFSRQAVQAKKSIEATEAAAAASKPVENVSSLSSAQPEKAPETKVDSSVSKVQEKPQQKRPEQFSPRQNGTPSQTSYRKFDSSLLSNGSGKANQFNRPQNGGQNRQFNGNQQRSFDNKKPNFNRPQNGGFGGKGQTNFVSTKVNNFRSFAGSEPEPMIVTPERQFGNKNKSPKKNLIEEKSRPTARKGMDNRKSVITMSEDGFEETTMGSRKLANKTKKKQDTVIAPKVTHLVLSQRDISVKDLSEKTGKPVVEIVKKLMILGIMATINSSIDFDTAELVCSELGITLELKLDKTMEEKLIDESHNDDEKDLKKRPPVVTVMGHVDHGKTSLLDAFRKSNVVSSEAGGITQKIGAYQITFNNSKITFIDTPGHAAFTQMRARGAKATDIAILVVAADDGIMPQTVEAINHIKAAGVPMIVAINKIDKPEANIDRVKQQLAEHDILPEEWGGNTVCVPVSAKTGAGMDELKSMILLVADMEELKANPNRTATGVILEAELDKNRGPVATVLVQNGTLKIGDSFLAGITYGKVKAMFDEKGKPVKVAPPSTPVSVLGFSEVPSSGDEFYVVSESLSKQVIQERIDRIKKEKALKTSGVSLDDFMDKVHEGSLKNLNLIIKADTQGSVEALSATLAPIQNEEAKVNIVHAAAGAVTESDVVLAQTTKAIIISFNIKPGAKAKQLAEREKIEIKEYKIIYEVVDDITRAISGMLSVKYEEQFIGYAEVRMVFKLSTAGKIAGCMMKDGKATRGCIAKVKRGNEEIGSTTVDSLKIVKDEKAEVLKGYEFGAKLHDDIDFKEGDTIEFYINVPIKRG